MLLDLLQKALKSGCNAIEIEYKDGKKWVTALHEVAEGFGVGLGIASVKSNSKQAKDLFKEMEELKKKKQIIVGGVKYRLVFSKYESFGEWAYKIKILAKSGD
jgi:hypothetical protein